MNITEAIKQYDKSNYLGFLKHFPEQIRDAYNLKIPRLKKSTTRIRALVIAGMGGSAIGGEMVQSLYYNDISIPVQIVRDYYLPSFVNTNTLVVVSSYSGNTEETLSAYDQARQSGASIMCITTGGTLAQMAERDGMPVLILPKGYQPRAALGFSMIPLIQIMHKLKLLPDKTDDIKETIEHLSGLENKFGPNQTTTSEPLKLAQQVAGKIPVVYTAAVPFNSLGTRWKCQFNENAKVFAYCNSIPELNHNEIMGWDKDSSRTGDVFAIFLRDEQESQSLAQRMEITKEIIRAQSGKTREIWSTGSSILTRAFSLLYFGDYTSYYLALLNKKDPSNIDNINFLKSKLKRM